MRERRVHQNFTQERLARTAEVSRFTVQRIESGRDAYSIDALMRVARALDTTLGELER